MSMQEVQHFQAHELPWAVAAILHCMAVLPAEPSARPGPITRAAGAVLHCACMLWGFPATAMREAVRAAAQRDQVTAGEPDSFSQVGRRSCTCSLRHKLCIYTGILSTWKGQ